MGRYGIDYESVVEVADTLAAQGQTATVERVRAALGTGSYTTLGRHLQMWRRARAPTQNEGAALPEMINDAAQAVWANLSRAAQDQVAQAEVAAQTAVAEAQESAEAACAAMQAELEAQAATHALELEYAERARAAQATANAKLAENLAASEGEREALSQKLARVVATAEQMDVRLKSADALNAQHSETIGRLLEQAQQAAMAHSRILETVVKTTKDTQENQILQFASLLAMADTQREALSERLDRQMAALEALKRAPHDIIALMEKTEKATEHQIAAASMLRAIDNRVDSVDAKNGQLQSRVDEVLTSISGIAQATAPAKQEAFRQEQHRAIQLELAALQSQLMTEWQTLQARA